MTTTRSTGAERVALVTGSSRGIGRSIVLALAEPTTGIVVHYRRDREAAEKTAAELIDLGAPTIVVRAEMESPDDIKGLVEAAATEFGRLDVVVANAASTAFRSLLRAEPHHIDRTFATVVRSFVLLVQEAVPLMGSGGRIIAMSGMDSDFVQAGHGLLGAAKAAMESLVRYFAVELGNRDITVNTVQPGYIASDSSRMYLGTFADGLEQTIQRYTPGGRAGTVDDVAAIVAWLCSPDAQFVTGQKHTFDGGLSLLGGPWAELNARLPY